jgi:hypothetical protein
MQMNNKDQIIQRYLLGELTESERAALEQEYFNDQSLLERIVEVENDLVDQHARGLLPPQTRERFQNYYLGHPQRMERAKFAEVLRLKLDESAKSEATTAEEPWSARLFALLRGPRPAWAFATALLLFAVLAGWLLIETGRLRRELARTESERLAREGREREMQQQVANEQSRAAQLADELERLRNQQNAAAPSPSPAPSAFATLMLTIAGTRSNDVGPPSVLRIPASTEQVKLQLRLTESNYSRYQIVLQSAGGATILTSKQLAAASQKTVTLFVPAKIFTSGDYILTLRGVSKTGEAEDVSKSLFRVEKQ